MHSDNRGVLLDQTAVEIRKSIFRFLLCLLITTPSSAFGHASGENYVWLSIFADRVEGDLEINFDDLDEKLNIDTVNTQLSSVEFAQTHSQAVSEYAAAHFSLGDDDGDYALEFKDAAVKKLPEGRFLSLPFVATPANAKVADLLNIEHSLLTENDPLHRGLVLVKSNAVLNKQYDEQTTLVFGPHTSVQTLDVNNPPRLLEPLQFVYQGVIHILYGLDHVLFLFTLLLTSVLRPSGRNELLDRFEAVSSFREAFLNIVGIVTAFTIAHSVTLGLAATGLVQLPPTLVEPVIALSIIVLALANFLPTRQIHRFGLIFFFGLFHGLGFASVMGVLAFRVNDIKQLLLNVILTFNIGVELGQLLLVLIVFPLLYAIRHWRGYTLYVVYGLSLVIAAIGLYWIAERTGALA